MSLQVGRTLINAPILRSRRVNQTLEIECWHYTDEQMDNAHAIARAINNDLQGQRDELIALTSTGYARLDGFYILREVEVETISPAGRFPVTLTLDYLGSEQDVRFQSRVVGTVKTNDYSVTESGSEPILAPPPHVNYDPRHTTTTVSRSVAYEDDLTVYRDIPFTVDPLWSASPENWYVGACAITRRDPMYPEQGPFGGLNAFIGALEDIELTNGIVRFYYSTAGVFNFGVWDGTAWRDKPIYFVAEGVAVTTWNHVAIIDNRPEQATIRFEGGATGRVTLDVTVRRGALGVSTLLSADTASTLGVYDAALTDMTVTSNRSVYTAADANGQKLMFASTKTFGSTPTDGYIWIAGTTLFDAFVGMELSGAVTGNQAVALSNQYLAAVVENVRVVRR